MTAGNCLTMAELYHVNGCSPSSMFFWGFARCRDTILTSSLLLSCLHFSLFSTPLVAFFCSRRSPSALPKPKLPGTGVVVSSIKCIFASSQSLPFFERFIHNLFLLFHYQQNVLAKALRRLLDSRSLLVFCSGSSSISPSCWPRYTFCMFLSFLAALDLKSSSYVRLTESNWNRNRRCCQTGWRFR